MTTTRTYRAAYVMPDPESNGAGTVLTRYEDRNLPYALLIQAAREEIQSAGLTVDDDDIVIGDWTK